MDLRSRETPWPNATAYRAAVTDPSALGDPDVRARRVETDSRGGAKEYLGTAAVVFRFTGGDGDVALRCFRRRIDRLDRRYTAIAELLRYVRSDALCRAAYLPKGIRVGVA
ncbi:MAG: hypothetical protein JO199_09825, partial [Candidatus Eremiobacteraeota bacterium]|nr:hypothetical protein [Candidatus Eremiobacteraeota bacterium]